METKATNINYITPKGTKVAIRIERKYGYYIQPAWTEKVWLDQPLEITHEEEQKFEDSAVILVNLAGKSVRATRVHKGEAPLGTKFGEGLYAELAGGKKAFIQLSDEVAETIDELCVEILNDDEPQEVKEIKEKIKDGKVMPKAQLDKLNEAINEGGEGYNLYSDYVTTERVEYYKQKYPNLLGR